MNWTNDERRRRDTIAEGSIRLLKRLGLWPDDATTQRFFTRSAFRQADETLSAELAIEILGRPASAPARDDGILIVIMEPAT